VLLLRDEDDDEGLVNNQRTNSAIRMIMKYLINSIHSNIAAIQVISHTIATHIEYSLRLLIQKYMQNAI
ncbi:MAG: hypothetical protein IJD27_07010, partial [Alistipes sp.]|nr:hypothetical protein [Alistipes sp.]